MCPSDPTTPAVLEVMNQLTPRHSIDTMACWSYEDMADMHMAYGAVNGNARGGCIRSGFPTDICVDIACFANIQSWLREHGSFNGPANYVIHLRMTSCNTSVTILMQAPELQHVT